MWLHEACPAPNQTCAFPNSPSRKLPQAYIALLGSQSAAKIPEHTVAIVMVMAGRCRIESATGSSELRARRFAVCDWNDLPLISTLGRGLALTMGFSEAAMRRLTPNIGGQPIPGSGALDAKTMSALCDALRNVKAPTSEFNRREQNVRFFLHRINLLQTDLLADMIVSRRKSDAHKLQVMTRMQRARLFLEANADRYVCVPKLAQIAGYSPCYFTRTFRRVYGLSPKECAMRIRLERAREMLRDRQVDINQIARSCGYDDQAKFARAIGKYFGAPAIEARDEHWAVHVRS